MPTNPLHSLLRPTLRRLRHAAALCALLAGPAALCSGAQAAPAGPTAAQLAALVFPGFSDTRAGRVQTVGLPGGGGAPYAGWNTGPARVIVDPKLVLRTDTDHLTLIAAMVPAGADGKPAVAQMTPVGIAAYQFARAGAGWKVAGRQGIFAWRGFFGEVRLQAATLSASPKSQHQAVAIEYGSCWDGYCGTWLALYELDNAAVRREPAVETALSGNNVDGAVDCQRRLQPMVKARPPGTNVHDDGSLPGSHDCYFIEADWNIEPGRDQPGDLAVHYQGAMSRGDTHAAPPAAIDQRQVLRYGSGKYRAISGFNPVPPI